MSEYDVIYLGKKAEEMGFVRDTFEKVTRLADILAYLNLNPVLKNSLALKGGTAINLTIFNLPRLSVDIDLDYIINNSREEMLASREVINHTINRYMVYQKYSKNRKTKNLHSLDSWVYNFMGAAGNTDNIKIEINYSLRSHVLGAEERPIITEHFSKEYMVKSLSPIEIYASKMNALLSRAAARDLYDVKNMICLSLFEGAQQQILKKCIIFYAAISAKNINKTFDTKAIDSITEHTIKRDLMPVIKRAEKFNLDEAKKLVKAYISDLMILTKEEKDFLHKFEHGHYIPELLFEDNEILVRIKNHPMALWKTRNIKNTQ